MEGGLIVYCYSQNALRHYEQEGQHPLTAQRAANFNFISRVHLFYDIQWKRLID